MSEHTEKGRGHISEGMSEQGCVAEGKTNLNSCDSVIKLKLESVFFHTENVKKPLKYEKKRPGLKTQENQKESCFHLCSYSAYITAG